MDESLDRFLVWWHHWEMGRNRRWGLEERGRLLGTIPWNCILPWPLLCTSFFFFFFFASSLIPWGNSSFVGSHCYNVPLHNRPRNRASDHGLNSLRPWAITHSSPLKYACQVVSRGSTEAGVTHVFTSKAPGRDDQLPVASNCPVHNSMQIWEPFIYKRWLCFPSGYHFQESEQLCQSSCWRNCLKCTHRARCVQCEAKEKVNKPLVICLKRERETSINSCIYWSCFLIRKHGARN